MTRHQYFIITHPMRSSQQFSPNYPRSRFNNLHSTQKLFEKVWCACKKTMQMYSKKRERHRASILQMCTRTAVVVPNGERCFRFWRGLRVGLPLVIKATKIGMPLQQEGVWISFNVNIISVQNDNHNYNVLPNQHRHTLSHVYSPTPSQTHLFIAMKTAKQAAKK